MSLEITIFNTSDDETSPRVKFLRTKTDILAYLKERYNSNAKQDITIVFCNNSHLQDPIFLAKILSYQFKQRISNFSAAYTEQSRIYTITFTIN